MTRRSQPRAVLSALATAVILAACGGGGDDSGSNDGGSNATSISGTAAAGAPIIGNVTVRDSLGAQKTVAIKADGSYTVDVSDMTAPFQFRAVGTVGGRQIALSSVATEADIGNTINVTPFTDLIVANIAGHAVEDFLSGDEFAHLTTDELNAARDTLTQRLLPILKAFGVDASFDLLRTSFAANRENFDAVMDVVRVTVDPDTNQAVIRDLINNQQIADDLASKADATVIATPPEGSLNDAVTDLQKVEQLLADFTALFEKTVPAEDNAKLLAMLHPEFLDNGMTLEDFLDPDELPMVGSKLINPVIRERADNGDLLVSFLYSDPEGFDEQVEWYFRKDEAGKWRVIGNLRVVGVSLDPINHRFTQGETVFYSRHLELWIEAATAKVQKALLTGPGLVGPSGEAQLIFLRSVDDPDANFRLVGEEGGGSWIRECTEFVKNTCVDFSKVGNNVTYTVQPLDINGVAVGSPIKLEMERPPVSNDDAKANTSKWFATYKSISPASYQSLTDGVNISYSFTLPSDSAYVVQNLGLSSATNWFSSEDLGRGATSGVVGTWEGAAPSTAPNTWIHVKGPYNRRFITGQMFPG